MKLKRFVRSVFYTPSLQLINRLRLKGKRMALVQMAKFSPIVTPSTLKPSPHVSANPPQRLLPQLDHSEVNADGEFTFFFLNAPRTFQLPIPWHLAELNIGTRLWKLHLHYFDYTQNLDNAAFEVLVANWITDNRPYRQDYWLDCWNSYALSIRVVAWMGEYAIRRDRLDTTFCDRLVASIAEQIDFLIKNIEEDIGGNHIIRNIKALYWAGSFFSGAIATRCNSLGNRLLAKELDRQILSDGFHFELSPAYHCQVFGDLMDCWRLMPSGSLRDRLENALRRMAQVTADITHPDGYVSLFNDGGLNMTWSPETLLSAYKSLFGLSPVPRSHALLDASGYYIVRHSDYYLLYDAGKVGPDGLPAHAHGDIFAFELTVGKHRVFIDAGVYEYNAGEKRSKSRSTLMHNTLTLDDLDQCEFWGSFRMGRRAGVIINSIETNGELKKIDAEHTGFTYLPGKPIHRRVLEILPENIIHILDEIKGGYGQRAIARLLLHPDVGIGEIKSNSVQLISRASTILVSSECLIRIVESVWWPDFGKEVPIKALEFDYGDAPGKWGIKIDIQLKNCDK